MGSLLTMLLGGFAGYALGELDALRVRGGQLEKKVEELKKQLAELQGRQRDSAGRPEEPVVGRRCGRRGWRNSGRRTLEAARQSSADADLGVRSRRGGSRADGGSLVRLGGPRLVASRTLTAVLCHPARTKSAPTLDVWMVAGDC